MSKAEPTPGTGTHLIEMDPPSLAQAAAISEFLQGQSPNQRHSEKDHFTRWKLCENRTHPGFATVMVAGPGDRIVSACTVTPKRLWRRGTQQLAGEIGDTFTDAAHLRQGMFAALVNGSRSRAQASGFRVIYGLPNENSLPGYVKKLDFRVKADLHLDLFSAILSTRSVAARTRVASMPGVRTLLSSSLVADASRKLIASAVAWRADHASRIRIEAEQSFGPDFDALWANVRASLPNAQIRDARYLTWRFEGNPFPFVVLGARVDGRLVGYVATLTLKRDAQGSFAHTILSDWLYDRNEAGAKEALLFGALRHALDQKADAVSAMISRSSPLPLPFGAFGFIHRPRETPVIVHQNAEGRELLDDPSPWHFTWSDTDGF